MIKNIVFDLGSVLLEKASSSLEKFNLTEEEKSIIKSTLFLHDNCIKLDYGYICEEDYFNELKKQIPKYFHTKALYILKNYFKYRDIKEDMFSLLKNLKQNNYNIYILSNNNINVYNYLKQTELNNYIDGWIVSAMYHTIKPNEEIYKILFNEFDLKPSESYFIDDVYENIETSIKLGMKGYVYKGDTLNLINELRNNDINI